MALKGMDVDQVRELARAFDKKAKGIEGVVTQIETGLRDTEWLGADRDRFEEDLEGTIKPNLKRLSESLRTTAEELRGEARKQDLASNG